MKLDAGCRPGGRGPFVSAKGPKTIDAQFGYIRLVGCKEGRRANSLRSDKARCLIRASAHGAEQQASDREGTEKEGGSFGGYF